MDPATVLALVTALISSAPAIISDVEKLIETLKGGTDSGFPAPPAAPVAPLAPQVLAGMAAEYAKLLAAQAARQP